MKKTTIRYDYERASKFDDMFKN